MRKSLKKLRYIVEYFGSLQAGRREAVREQLKKLQDVFGYVNDVATAGQLERISEEHCRESRECQRAAGYIFGWHTAEAAHCWTHVENGWKDLKRTRCFLR